MNPTLTELGKNLLTFLGFVDKPWHCDCPCHYVSALSHFVPCVCDYCLTCDNFVKASQWEDHLNE
jgi:hypothetical protein